jgi:hypothetical protein
MLVPFIYVQLKLRYPAYKTAAAHLRAIQAFYTYEKSRDLDIDESILAGHFEAILALLDGYTLWLQSGRQADNLRHPLTEPFPQNKKIKRTRAGGHQYHPQHHPEE